MAIGILAYGSLIEDPGGELQALEADRRAPVKTPFKVEFARSSNKRGGGATLVPVQNGGAHVDATLIVLKPEVTLRAAQDALYRREIGQVGTDRTYQPDPKKKNQVWVRCIEAFEGLDYVLYTEIIADISPLTAQRLAELAVASAQGEHGLRKQDGISYLAAAKRAGIRTPLSEAYEAAILDRTRSATLDEAWHSLRRGNTQNSR